MNFFNIIWPNDIWLQGIIIVMIALFLWVAKAIIRVSAKSRTIISQIELFKDVEQLEAALLNKNCDREGIFNVYVENLQNKNNVVFEEDIKEHLHTIYEAGLNCSRLDGKLLVNNTIGKIFKDIDLLKSRISMFLILGILGTLIGLGSSIVGFANITVSSTNTNELNNILQNLFGHLKGAFAPSIWGVSLTLLTSYLYSKFVHYKAVNGLTDKLTSLTIKIWLPRLYPTEYQRGEQTVLEFKETVKNAKNINTSVNKLQNNLNESNSTVQAFNTMADTIKGSANEFKVSMQKVGDIEKIYDQIVTNSELFNEKIYELVDNTENVVNKRLTAQLNRLGKIQESMEACNLTIKTSTDKNSASMFEATQSMVQTVKLLKGGYMVNHMAQQQMIKVAERIATQEDKIVGRIMSAIQGQLAQNTKAIEDINKGLSRIQNPLDSTSEAMRIWMTNSFNKTEELSKNVNMAVNQLGAMANSMQNMAIADMEKLNQYLELIKKQQNQISQIKDSIKTIGDSLVKQGNLAGGEWQKAQRGEKENWQSWLKKNASVIVIGVLLLSGVIMQGVMVQKIGQWQTEQVRISNELQQLKTQNNEVVAPMANPQPQQASTPVAVNTKKN